ncbi:MAG: DUF4080 domain-containing protein, partial [Clostridia bacterium]
ILKIYPKDKLQMEIGIQSTNHKTLEAIDRPSDIRKAIENMKMLKGFGNIKIHADLIAGLPFDDISAISKSFDDIFHVCDELQLGFLKLLKGTKIRDQEAEYSFKYNEEAPYEVYENCFLSFDEIFLLKRIAALTERYKNSRHFINSCEYIISFSASAFSFFKGLDKFINCNISAVSQHEAFRYLYEYSSFFIKKDINENDWDVFITGIQKDYMKCLNRKAPKNFI